MIKEENELRQMQEAVAKYTGPIAKLPAGKLSKRRNVDATPKWKLRWSEALDRKAWGDYGQD